MKQFAEDGGPEEDDVVVDAQDPEYVPHQGDGQQEELQGTSVRV